MLQIGSVRTNFSMPDVLSIGLGGGSIVVQSVTKGEAQVIQTYCPSSSSDLSQRTSLGSVSQVLL